MREATLLIVGNGILAGHVLYILSHGSQYKNIVLASRNMESAVRKANTIRQHVLNLGKDLDVQAVPMNLDSLSDSAATIARANPDVIFNTASLQSWWVVNELPADIREMVAETRFGPWLPMHLSPTLKLMQAVREASSDAVVVNAAFPDAVNPVLARNGLAPSIGIGNIANVVPALRIAVAEALDVRPNDVEVRICGHHFVSYRLSRLGHSDGAPVFFHASVNGGDVTREVNQAAIFKDLTSRQRRTGGVAGQPVTASSAVAILEALQSRSSRLVHAPGPDGLPGGYPVRVSKSESVVSLPKDFSLEGAVEVNEKGQVHDGIEIIEADGTVRFAEPQMTAMKDLFDYECPSLALDDVHMAADDLGARYQRFLAARGLSH